MSRASRRATGVVISMSVLVLAFAASAGGARAADRAVSPSGSDGNPCTPSAPCQSFERGYEAASPGDVVHVAGGDYAGQTINANPKSGGPDVVFKPAAGAAVSVRKIDVTRAAHVEFQGMTVLEETYNRPEAQFVTYRGVKMTMFFIRGADHISYINSEVGPNSAGSEVMNWISAAYATSDAASDILFDGVRIHDFKKYSDDAHIDCIGIDDVDGLVIRNSKIWNCEHFSIIFGNDTYSGRAVRNAVLENNFLDCCYSGYYSVGIGGIDGPLVMRFNSMSEGVGWLNGTNLVPNGQVTLDSNVLASNSSSNCSRGDWRFNVVASGSSCGGKSGATGFVGPPSDLHLQAGSPAIGAGNPQSHPERDIDGQRRAPGAPEAGADQVNVAGEATGLGARRPAQARPRDRARSRPLAAAARRPARHAAGHPHVAAPVPRARDQGRRALQRALPRRHPRAHVRAQRPPLRRRAPARDPGALVAARSRHGAGEAGAARRAQAPAGPEAAVGAPRERPRPARAHGADRGARDPAALRLDDRLGAFAAPVAMLAT